MIDAANPGRPAPPALTEPLLDIALRPHRSLTPAGFVLVIAAIGAIAFVAGIVFLLHGAWPVTGFLGLDVLLVYLAFKANYRSGRTAEEVKLTRDLLVVRRRQPNGRRRIWTFRPASVALELSDPDGHRCRLTISDRGRSVIVGAFLAPEERVDLAATLGAALDRARRPLGI